MIIREMVMIIREMVMIIREMVMIIANFFPRRKEIRKYLEVKDEGISDDLLRSFYAVFRLLCGINRLHGGSFSESKMMDLRAPRKMIMTKS